MPNNNNDDDNNNDETKSKNKRETWAKKCKYWLILNNYWLKNSNYNNWFEAGEIKNKNILENNNTEDEGGHQS